MMWFLLGLVVVIGLAVFGSLYLLALLVWGLIWLIVRAVVIVGAWWETRG